MGSLDLSGLDAPAPADDTASKAPLRKFEEDPDNPRTEFDGPEFDAFVEDVRQRGILQPVVVQRMPSGKLRIRFGARRFRAAKRLELGMLPYVVADDERHLDPYSQVSENEQRKNLEPLELASFIAKRVSDGESKTEIGKKLGLTSSAVTNHLALIDSPPFITELYRSGKCRSVQMLYRLRRLHTARPDIVESQVAAAEVTTSLLDTLAAQIDAPDPAPESAPMPADNALAPSSRSSQSPTEVAPTPDSSAAKRRSDSRKLEAAPLLLGRCGGRDVSVDLLARPTKSGRVFVRYSDDGAELEVAFSEIARLRLANAAP